MIPNSLINAASFTPNSLQFPNAWVGHLPFAAWVIQEVSPTMFVELGTHSGNSYFSFCQSVAEAGISTKCYAVDTWQGDEHAGQYDEEVFAKVNAYHQEHYAGFSRLLRMTFDDALTYFGDGSINLLHIDGLHTYEAVRHDFEAWLPKLAPGAVVLFHDTNVRERNFGVWKLWQELQLDYPNNLEFMHSHGLGVLQLNNAPDDKRLEWLQFDSPEKQRLINYFASIGSRQFERYQLNELKLKADNLSQSMTEQNGHIATLNQAIAEYDNQIVSLNQTLIDRDEQIVSLNQTLTDRDKQIVSLNQTLIDRDKQIVSLNQTLTDRDKQIVSLNQTLTDRNGQIVSINQILTNRDEQIVSFNQILTDRDEQIVSLNKAMAERDCQISNLRDEVDRIVIEKTSEIRNVQQQLNQILRARTWRVMAPLRKAVVTIKQGVRSPRKSFLRKIAKSLLTSNPYFQNARVNAEVKAIRKSGLFDESFYLSMYPDLKPAPHDPIRHYCKFGWREGRNPSDDFDTSFYLTTHSDIRNAGMNPFYHYVVAGASEQRLTMPDMSMSYEKDIALDAEVEAIRKSGLFNESFYLSMYPDLQPALQDPIRHYCEHGWREGKNPSDDFDSRFYLETYSDVRNAGMNPFYHYVAFGALELRHAMPDRNTSYEKDIAIEAEIEAIRKSGLFDESFYLSMYPDLKPAPQDPIRHYCEHGWREGKSPSDDFDTRFYLETYNDIRNAGMNPFYHYVEFGALELRHAMPDMNTSYEKDIWFGASDTDIKLLAFYMSPDWATLRRGRTMLKGNSQLLPHEELGFYDPSDWRVLEYQAKLAKCHGLYGFCFDVGIGAAGGVSPQPLESFLSHVDIDFRFCVQVELRPESIPSSLIATLLRAVSDRRFICIKDRPIILVTMHGENQHAAPALDHLRQLLADEGIESPFLIGRWEPSGEHSPDACLADQFDAMLDLPRAPVPGETGNFLPRDKNGVDVVCYGIVASQGVIRARKAHSSAYPLYHAVTLGRHSTAQGPERPLVYTRFHVRDYRRWLDAAIAGAKVAHPEDRRFVFVNAWNAWNEGLIIEPDMRAGFARLNETSRALLNIASDMPMPKVSVIVPNYNHELFLRRRLSSIYGQTYKNIEVILMDDSSSDSSRSLLDEFATAHPDITRTLYNDENSGGAFRQWAKGIKAATGDLVWIAESDDYCDEDFLEVLVRYFEDEAVLLAYAKSSFVDKNEVPIRDDFQNYLSDLESAEKWNGSYVETAHNEVKSALGIKNTIPNASGVLFKRPINMHLLDDESWLSMAVAGDWVFYLHLIRGGKIAYTTETTNFFRRYEGSTAEVTYKKEVFYREVGAASRTVAALYNVPLAVLDQSRRTYQTVYENKVGGNDEEFALWYDYQSIVQARENRLPNVMVSTMGFFPGGAEILPIRLANEFKRQGLSVLLLNAGLNPSEDGVRRMLRNDVPVIETSSVEDVKAIIHDFGVEVLNTHQWHIQKYPMQVPDVFDELRGHVASLHGMIEHGNAFGVTTEELRTANKGVTTWVYTAQKNLVPFVDAGLYVEHSPRFVKIPNGMQPPRVVPIPRADIGIPDDAFVLCCVSRAIPDKGWAEAIQVVEHARKLSGRDIRLILVGNGPAYDEYCRVGVPDFVYLAGFSENSVGHYAAADMGIMLTKFKSESFPLTIVDCLFAGKPYIASDVGDIRNMLTTSDDVAGEVIALENWEVPIEKAAQVVAAFATDKQKYQNALALVKEVANRYQIDVVAKQYVSLFESSRDKHRL